MRKCADFCPLAKGEAEAPREEVASPGDPGRKAWSKASLQDRPLSLCSPMAS